MLNKKKLEQAEGNTCVKERENPSSRFPIGLPDSDKENVVWNHLAVCTTSSKYIVSWNPCVQMVMICLINDSSPTGSGETDKIRCCDVVSEIYFKFTWYVTRDAHQQDSYTPSEFLLIPTPFVHKYLSFFGFRAINLARTFVSPNKCIMKIDSTIYLAILTVYHKY